MMDLPAPTPAPLHDIVDVVGYFPYPWWVVALAGAVLLALLGWLVTWILRPRLKAPLSPQARAVLAMAALQGEKLSPYEFAVRVSSILREFMDEAYGIRAVTATSLEFLESIKDHPRFGADERAALRDFLETADLLKFARVEADQAALDRLLAAAEGVVRKPLAEGATA
jgi:hypothetical protein